jgi:hypothetical protein
MSQNQKILGRPLHQNQISPNLDRKLVAYAAAGAATVALLSTAQPAEAKIVYTHANVHGENITIDLNHDGVPDFSINQFIGHYELHFVGVSALAGGNLIQVSPAFAGFRGSPNGPGDTFSIGTFYNFYALIMTTSNYPNLYGTWANITNRYLGFKFIFSGQTHYGWARLSINNAQTPRGPVIVLSGYAYETVPNTQITEGATSDIAALDAPDPLDSPTAPSSPSLGMLACGIDALPVWRREYVPVAIKRDDSIMG